jgi:hypothetical protein
MLSIGILFDLLIDFTEVLSGDGGVITTSCLHFLDYDNLGSIDTITDGQGNIVERMSYAAFGERRKGDWRVSDPLLPKVVESVPLVNCFGLLKDVQVMDLLPFLVMLPLAS